MGNVRSRSRLKGVLARSVVTSDGCISVQVLQQKQPSFVKQVRQREGIKSGEERLPGSGDRGLEPAKRLINRLARAEHSLVNVSEDQFAARATWVAGSVRMAVRRRVKALLSRPA